MTDRFAAAARVADAVLYEGYVLYPYRASAAKNQFRWQFGVVAPRAPHEDGEPWFAQTDCLVCGSSSPRLLVRARFLRPSRANGESATANRDWLEGVPHSIDLSPISLSTLPYATEQLFEARGVPLALAVRANREGPYVKVRLTLENRTPWLAAFESDRDAMLERSLVGAHLLLAVDGGAFISLLEPPDEAAAAVLGCSNRHTWPVLIGDRGRSDLMLSSPIVLYDFPNVARESRGDLCDAAEIDEILTLRILTMTDEEKREARATDPRARHILDHVDAMSTADLEALHGTMRSADFFNPRSMDPPERAFIDVGGCRVEKGSHVTLRPNRRADAMDMFLRGQAATVAGIYRDVDDRTYVAVTIDADPAAALQESFGRFFYFDPSEIDPAL